MTNFKVGDKVTCSPKQVEQWPGLGGVKTIKYITPSGLVGFEDCDFVGIIGEIKHVPPAVTIDPARTYRTRDGREVRILCVDGPDPMYPVVAVVQNGGDWNPDDFTADGRINASETAPSPDDLIEVKPERVGWVNIYPSFVSPDLSFSKQYEIKEAADRAAMGDRIACVYLRFREGDGLEGGK